MTRQEAMALREQHRVDPMEAMKVKSGPFRRRTGRRGVTIPLCFTLTQPMDDAIERIATTTNRPRSAVVRQAVVNYIEAFDEAEARKNRCR